MIAWTLAFLAVASAAPQLQLQQPLRSQVISAQQIPLGQTYQTSSDYQQIPLNFDNLNFQQQVHAVPIQTVQTIQTSQPRVSYQSVPLNVQSLPINTVNTVNYQQLPVQQVRLAQVKPVTQYRTQAVRTSVVQPIVKTALVQPVIQNTPVTVQHHVVPQVHNIQVQQRLSPQLQGLAILRQVQDVQADGTYSYAFETENGIKAQEEGRTLNQGATGENSVVQGSYSYVSPEGETIAVNYVADENGFRAEGDHIPKVPEAIQRSLEYLRSLPARPEDQEGQYVPDKNGY